MSSNNRLLLTSAMLFGSLAVILWPSITNMGDLMTYAVNAEYQGVSLIDVFAGELVIILTVWIVLLTYKGEQVDANNRDYINRFLVLILFILGQVFMGFFAGGLLVHQDAAWYQVAHESDEVMPSLAVIFMVCYPMYLFFGGSAYLYSKTRLAKFTEHKLVYFLVLTFAPLAFLPYYDADLLKTNREAFDFLYVIAYWLLSISWMLYGVIFLLFKIAREILKGLNHLYDE